MSFSGVAGDTGFVDGERSSSWTYIALVVSLDLVVHHRLLLGNICRQVNDIGSSKICKNVGLELAELSCRVVGSIASLALQGLHIEVLSGRTVEAVRIIGVLGGGVAVDHHRIGIFADHVCDVIVVVVNADFGSGHQSIFPFRNEDRGSMLASVGVIVVDIFRVAQNARLGGVVENYKRFRARNARDAIVERGGGIASLDSRVIGGWGSNEGVGGVRQRVGERSGLLVLMGVGVKDCAVRGIHAQLGLQVELFRA